MPEKEEYMKRALELARKGEGHTSPNPMVGCVVVKDGRIISEGYHEKYGEFHAERNALTRCTEDTTGADLYVTLGRLPTTKPRTSASCLSTVYWTKTESRLDRKSVV